MLEEEERDTTFAYFCFPSITVKALGQSPEEGQMQAFGSIRTVNWTAGGHPERESRSEEIWVEHGQCPLQNVHSWIW